jgi:hypothetical protein
VLLLPSAGEPKTCPGEGGVGQVPLFFGTEKCPCVLGAKRALAPSPSLGTSTLFAPNTMSRQGEAAADGWCLGAVGGLSCCRRLLCPAEDVLGVFALELL